MKSKQKTEIKPGQIWRDKRGHREVRVIGCAEGPAPGGGRTTLRITYEPHNYTLPFPPGYISESCFRGDYELVSAPTEAQKEADRTEVDKFKAYLSDPQSKTDQHAAYAGHYGQVVFVAKKEQ